MKTALLVALVGVNLALALALVVTQNPTADAQVLRGGTDYIVQTALLGTEWDAVWVVDLRTRRLVVWKFDKTKKELVPMRGRRLIDDFGRKPSEF